MISNLQIISGKYRGRKLVLPPSARPTQNKARIALFNMLSSIDVQPRIVWDAFAGSGAFGAEFLSRTDAHVIFTDISADAFKAIGKNTVNMPNKTIEMVDAINAIKRHGAVADLIFIDPLYAENELAMAFVRKLTQVAKSGAILVWESESMQIIMDGWIVLRDKQYGRARFLILQKA
jgi:16S rRNA (guanine966-N2)-methyltransferase